MDLNLNPGSNTIKFEGYGSGFFKLSGKKIKTPILIFPDRYIAIKSNKKNNIKNEIINYSNEYKIDLIIYGNPLGLESSKDLITKELNSLNIPLEIMNTDAACRTWTVLVSEGRCVCAFIKPQR